MKRFENVKEEIKTFFEDAWKKACDEYEKRIQAEEKAK